MNNYMMPSRNYIGKEIHISLQSGIGLPGVKGLVFQVDGRLIRIGGESIWLMTPHGEIQLRSEIINSVLLASNPPPVTVTPEVVPDDQIQAKLREAASR